MFDLSALDAELDGLGRAPENAESLAQTFAGITLSGKLHQQLEQVDAELSTLADVSALSGVVSIAHSTPRIEPALRVLESPPPFLAAAPEPEPEPQPESLPPPPSASPALTESQEIVLPDPIAREELSSESGELRLSGDDPSSGSFELPDSPTEPRIMHEDPARSPDSTQSGELLPFDDVQDALEGSQPIAVTGRATLSPHGDLDRDPDAEFDALLSEATDPRGIPTAGGSSEIDTEDLLRGLEGDEDAAPYGVSDQNAPHEAELLTRSLYEDSGEHTDILDRAALGTLERAARESGEPNPGDDDDATLAEFNAPDELDIAELEIVMDDEPTLAPQALPLMAAPKAAVQPPPPRSPTARPGLSNKAPPPPPPSSNPEKRPSGGLLGRLFTKREGE